jgi:hypothetical protein
MHISQAATASPGQHTGFTLFGNLEQDLAGLCIFGNRSQRHFDDYIFSVFPGARLPTARLTVTGEDVFPELQVQQGPHLGVPTHNDVTATTPVASVGPSFGYKFLAPHVTGTGTALPRAAKYFNVIYEVRFCHIVSLLRAQNYTHNLTMRKAFTLSKMIFIKCPLQSVKKAAFLNESGLSSGMLFLLKGFN